jgi:hypothetical protein
VGMDNGGIARAAFADQQRGVSIKDTIEIMK